MDIATALRSLGICVFLTACAGTMSGTGDSGEVLVFAVSEDTAFNIIRDSMRPVVLEGSIVLWGVVLAGFTWLVSRKVGHGDGLGLGALAVLGALSVFWFGLMATAANPFAICTEVVNGACAATSGLPIGAAVAPADGLGPNALLQNHILMAIHPPWRSGNRRRRLQHRAQPRCRSGSRIARSPWSPASP